MQSLPWDTYAAWWDSRPAVAGPGVVSLELVQFGIKTCPPCLFLKTAINSMDWSAVPVCLQGHMWSVDLHQRPVDDNESDRLGDPVGTVDRYPTMVLLSRGHQHGPPVRVEETWVRPDLPQMWPEIVAAAQVAQYRLQSDDLNDAFHV